MKSFLVLFLVLLLAGCGDSASQSPANSLQTGDVTPRGAEPTAPHPDLVLVTVNGNTLTVKECDEAVRLRLDPIKKRLQPQRIPEVTKKLKARLIREFVFETLLMEEAKRQGITVTEDDERQALERIDEHIKPRGTSVDEVLATSPAGEDRLRGEILTAIYVERLLATFMTNDLAVTDEAVETYLSQNRDKLAVPERVHARHILLTTGREDTKSIKEEKLRKLSRIRQEILDGADFAEMARKYSACPSSERGGDLGRFTRGQMAKPFEVAAFAQKTNEVGRVLETQYGYHIIQVLEHTPPGLMSRDEASTVLQQQNRTKALRRLMHKLVPEAQIDPPELAELVLK